MRILQTMSLVTGLVLLCVVSAYAKGRPDKITISGGSSAQALEITDRETLKKFDPWIGQFIDWKKPPLTATPGPCEAFSVSFYMKWSGRRKEAGDLSLI